MDVLILGLGIDQNWLDLELELVRIKLGESLLIVIYVFSGIVQIVATIIDVVCNI